MTEGVAKVEGIDNGAPNELERGEYNSNSHSSLTILPSLTLRAPFQVCPFCDTLDNERANVGRETWNLEPGQRREWAGNRR